MGSGRITGMTSYTTDGDLCAGHHQDCETAMAQNLMEDLCLCIRVVLLGKLTRTYLHMVDPVLLKVQTGKKRRFSICE